MAVEQIQRTFGAERAVLTVPMAPSPTATVQGPQTACDSLRTASPLRRRGIPATGGLVPVSGLVAPADAAMLRHGVQGIGGTAVAPVVPADRVEAGVPTSLRLGLVVAQSQAVIGVTTPTTVGGMTLIPGQSYQIRLDGGQLSITDMAGRHRGAVPLPARIEPSAGGVALVGGHRYRGSLEVIASPGAANKLTVVNEVGIEDYLQGVLPAEMATGWPAQALQAQAVAARTYAAANMGRRADQGFDLFPTVSDQVYKGEDSEAADTSAAVAATRGVVMTYKGSLINAVFFSSSGGCTDDAKAVWDADMPYIQAVPDPDGSPNAVWRATLTPEQVSQALTKIGVAVGTPKAMTVTTRTPGGRARWLAVSGTTGSATVDANKFRLAVGLKSTKYELSHTRDGWQFDGSGYGHGLGMSQWGAHNRAQAGETYREILSTYYTGITISAPPETH